MTLDDAIRHAEEVAEENYGKANAYLSDREVYKHEEQKCLKCADEHMQLAEWLKDYKRLLEQEPKWIPCSERLPEDSGEYFVSIIDKYYDENYEDIGIAPFAHKKDYSIKESEWQIDETVIAWMPLPKPYKAESEEK